MTVRRVVLGALISISLSFQLCIAEGVDSVLNEPSFQNGTLLLKHSWFGQGIMGNRELNDLYQKEQWSDLTTKTVGKKYVSNLYYFYLGRAAEESGYLDAALTYFKNATDRGVFQNSCNDFGILEHCRGIVLPRDALARIEKINFDLQAESRAANAKELEEKAKIAADLLALRAEENAAQAKINAELREAERKVEVEQLKREIDALIYAETNSSVKCKDKPTCSKIFALSQIYVNKNADQKIQIATDTIIETYNPTEPLKIGMKVIKIPKRGTSEEIVISVSCNAGDIPQGGSYCRKKQRLIYTAFLHSTILTPSHH